MSKYDWPRHGNDPGPSAQGGSPPDFSGAASEHLLRDILPVLDNLERAVGAASSSEANSTDAAVQASRVESLVTGVKMVLHQFRETLGRFGVTRIESAGQNFDPSHHEAVA